MRSLTRAHSGKRPTLGRLRELRLYFLFLCTFFYLFSSCFFVLFVDKIFSLRVVSLYSHCWPFLALRGFCDHVFLVIIIIFVVVVVTHKCKEDHRSQRRKLYSFEKKAWKKSGSSGFEPWPLQYRCRGGGGMVTPLHKPYRSVPPPSGRVFAPFWSENGYGFWGN